MGQRYVFISHPGTGVEFARSLARDLERAGIPVWFAERDLVPGQDFVYAIDHAIQKSDAVLAVLSGQLAFWQTHEIRSALNCGKRVIPVLVGEGSWHQAPAELRNVLGVDLRQNYEARVRQLVAALQRSLTLPQMDSPRSPAPGAGDREIAEEERKRREAERARWLEETLGNATGVFGRGRGEPPGATQMPYEIPDATQTRAGSGADRVQVRAYYPVHMRPNEAARKVLAYLHSATPEATHAVETHSQGTLKNLDYPVAEESADVQRQLAIGTRVTVAPEAEDCRFAPASASFNWKPPFRVAEFRVSTDRDTGTGTGNVNYFVGPLLIASVPLLFEFSRAKSIEQGRIVESASLYQRIFPSYSHRDSRMVKQLERAYRALGSDVLRDIETLKSGERWAERLQAHIREADVFQLFWSRAAAKSPEVEKEWTYALKLDRERFIRPLYWQEPMPTRPKKLSDVHFAKLELSVWQRVMCWLRML